MGIWTEATSHTAPHYTIDTGRLKEQKTVTYASTLQIYFLLEFIQFASYVSHQQESISLSNFDTMPLCFKYHIVEFSSKHFFHQLQVNREDTHFK